MQNKLTLPVDVGDVSDGYHSFNELYAHRCTLFAALMMDRPEMSWVSKLQDDGTELDGWFIGGMDLPTGQVTYHLPSHLYKSLTVHVPEIERSKWDGHTSNDVLRRMTAWIDTKRLEIMEGTDVTNS